MDPDVFAYLYPPEGAGCLLANKVISSPQNKSRFLAAVSSRSSKEINESANRDKRGGTVPPEAPTSLENTNALVCRFSDFHQASLGIVIGSALDADIVIDALSGLSRYHLVLTFDAHGWPIARDLGSLSGSSVSYEKETVGHRSGFYWQLRGPDILQKESTVLHLSKEYRFRLVIPPHDVTSTDYRRRVAEFREKTKETKGISQVLQTYRDTRTELPSGADTPLANAGPCFFKKIIGSGAFGVVAYMWNVATREQFVLKEPKKDYSSATDLVSWKNEARIMKSISHDNIVTFLGATFSSVPQLRFEYVPGGSLDQHSGFSTLESREILLQLSSGLQYLHQQVPPIAHRDIKPENILVAFRDINSIKVKFADFGLSKAEEILKTICGTPLWAAPEILLKWAGSKVTNKTYDVGVDVWSLGMVIAQIECGLPDIDPMWRQNPAGWLTAVHDHVGFYAFIYSEEGSDLLDFLLDAMLVEDPKKRSSASRCFERVLTLPNCDFKTPFLERIETVDSTKLPGSLKLSNKVTSAENRENLNIPEASTIRSGRLQLDIGQQVQDPASGSSRVSIHADTQARETVVNRRLWEIKGDDTIQSQRDSQKPTEENSRSFLVRQRLLSITEALRNDIQETIELPEVAVRPDQSGRKRIRSENSNSAQSQDSLSRLFKDELSTVAAPQHNSDKNKSPPDPKRSKLELDTGKGLE